MKISPTAIQGVYVAETIPLKDPRGFFYRAFCEHELASVLQGRKICQINISQTVAIGAIRGLHYQNPPHAEMKLIRCLRGRVWDVALDLRQGSATFLRWHSEELSAENARMMVIPEGFAHGFQAMEPGSELLYLHTAPYDSASEGGVRYDDPAVHVAWPLAATDISQRDMTHGFLGRDFGGIAL
jgi:dTDP-4-dehydrorhamnose 3,5-epimerase